MSNNKHDDSLAPKSVNKTLPLGQPSSYRDNYAPELLCSIPRHLSREALGLSCDKLPFDGVDIWNAYELSWLNNKGKPVVAMAQCAVPCSSPNIIESKSFKLYLNSLNQTCFNSVDQLYNTLCADLSKAAGACVTVTLSLSSQWSLEPKSALVGECLDNLDIAIEHYQPNPALLQCDSDCNIVKEQLFTHLFRSLCPVTGQPDWASVAIAYTGQRIDQRSLLAYLIAYRQHQDFHEQCVERVFLDIRARCKPSELTVFAYFVRRGGLDINPYRSSNAVKSQLQNPVDPAFSRLARQ